MKYKIKLGGATSGSEDGHVTINVDQRRALLAKINRLLIVQLGEDLCRKHDFSYERYTKWFNNPKNE